MNMFRDLAILAFLALGLGLIFTDPVNWTWISIFGPYIAPSLNQAVEFLGELKPFSSMFCYALALALFMTRLKY